VNCGFSGVFVPITNRATAISLIALLLAACAGGGSAPSTTVLPADAPSSGTAAVTIESESPPPTVPNDPTHSYFVYPTFGTLGTGPNVSFQWSAVQGASGYQLQVGTTPDGSDIYDSGVLASRITRLQNLPAGVVLYARVRGVMPYDPPVEVNDEWTHGSDMAFRTDESVSGAVVNLPAGTAGTDQPLTWAPDPVAISYRLLVGTHPGGSQVEDSGSIHTTMRLVDYPRTPTKVYATLETTYRNRVARQMVSFMAGGPLASFQQRLAVGLLATATVREMANENNQPHGGTLLFSMGAVIDQGGVTCETYTDTLMRYLDEANARLTARPLRVCLNPNSFDCHELVEVFDPDSARWSTLDPTFGLQTLRADSVPATSTEISDAARASNWAALNFNFLTPTGDGYARQYYLDYPLLFVYIYTPDETAFVTAPPASLLQYYTLVGNSVNADAGLTYATQCAAGYNAVTALWNGTPQTYGCTGPDGMTPVEFAATISAEPGDQSLAGIWRVNRFIF
jgi:hypothetical protein